MSSGPAPRRALMAGATVLLAGGVSVASLLAVDVYLHHKYESTAGYNVWGYRGPVVPAKRSDEFRVVMLGGSSLFGYGVDAPESIPANLERRLGDRTVGAYRHFTVINLGYNNEGAYSFRFTLQDYSWLRYDLACLYEGYNDVMGINTSVFRHDSPIYRATGYLPIFPIIFREKAARLVYGDVNAIYRQGTTTVFHPSLGARAAAGALRAAADVEASLERQYDQQAADWLHRVVSDPDQTGCGAWSAYCSSIATATSTALGIGARVMVITQPYALGSVGAAHRSQQRAMADMLARRYGRDTRVQYVNLGDRIDLGDPALSYDHMHLTIAGNDIIARALVEPVVEMASPRP